MTQEEFKAKVAVKSPKTIVVGEFIDMDTPVLVRCSVCGYERMVTPKAILARYREYGCPKCAFKAVRKRRQLTEEDFADRLKKKNPTIKYVSGFKGTTSRVLVECTVCGHQWRPVAASLTVIGSGCPACHFKALHAHNSENSKFSKCNEDEIFAKIMEKNPDITILGEFHGKVGDKIRVKCNNCGKEREVMISSLLKGSKCRCARKMTKEQFVEKLNEVTPWIKLVGEYKGYTKKVRVRCEKCGRVWYATPNYLLSKGRGCSKCDTMDRYAEKFKEKLEALGVNAVLVGEYHGSNSNTTFKCKNCGKIFTTTPNNLLRGIGTCENCKTKYKPVDEKSMEKHIDVLRENFLEKLKGYNVNLSLIGEYVGGSVDTLFKCNDCGATFLMKPKHIIGLCKANRWECPYCKTESKSMDLHMAILKANFEKKLTESGIGVTLEGEYNGVGKYAKFRINGTDMCFWAKPGRLLKCGSKHLSKENRG